MSLYASRSLTYSVMSAAWLMETTRSVSVKYV